MTGAGEAADAQWRWWRERRLPAEVIHLDSAAAGRSSRATLAAAAAHAEREATVGAYVAMAEVESLLYEGQAGLAGLLGVPAAGVTFVPSAEAALDALLAIWPLSAGNKQGAVAVVPCEWGPNLHAFATRGLRITEIATHGDGAVDLAALERMLAGARPAFVHLTQVTSHRGLVQPVAEAAALCRAAGVPLWVDAAQALGHTDTACGADAIYATSRKWLTGPRGVGMLGVAEPWWDRLKISAPDLVATARPADSSPVWLIGAGEANVAAWVGLCTAVREYLQGRPASGTGSPRSAGRPGKPWPTCPDGRWPTPPTPGRHRRAARGERPGDRRHRARLLDEHGIVTTAGAVTRAPREMTEPLLRISPHVDCTPEDLTRLRHALLALG